MVFWPVLLFMNRNIARLLAFGLIAVFVTGCKSTGGGKKKNKKKDQLAFNGGKFGDPKYTSSVDDAIARAQKKVTGYDGRARRNPDMNLPPVDLSRAKSVTYSSVSIDAPIVSMTFDDGPHPTLTPRLLDILKQRNIKATFFVVGTNAKRYPHIIRRMVAEGHEVANHTVTHGTLTRMSDDSVRRELSGCHSSIVAGCGVAPRLFRPPGGAMNSRQKVWVNDEFGYKTIMWSCDPKDWQRPGVSVVAQRCIAGARPGAIILAHDIHSPTIAAMPRALDGILDKGYRFVTTSQLLSMQRSSPAISATEKSDTAPPKMEIKDAVPLPGESENETPAAVVEPEGGAGEETRTQG